jgi:hypothetical protein
VIFLGPKKVIIIKKKKKIGDKMEKKSKEKENKIK